eukprot:TRINITY_DN9191_c0_g1_i3.p1 TRINITY_DN9191_c0_g1~~TRINITY_DN9191_c0_g1_i3.p1  ORF type:complete len:188 (+),score=63.61 TRINITY_DN9191_c0_g1_i3:98-661(+)
MAFLDCLLIVCASLVSALLAEGISWLLIYRTESYQQLKASIERNSKKLEKKKEEVSGRGAAAERKSGKQKKVERAEESLKAQQQALQMVKFKSVLAVGFTMIGFVGLLNSIFDGVVVARLPFEPIGPVRGMSHRGLLGDDPRECAMIFLYVLCSLSIRPNLQKVLGLAPPKAAASTSSWLQPPAPPR